MTLLFAFFFSIFFFVFYHSFLLYFTFFFAFIFIIISLSLPSFQLYFFHHHLHYHPLSFCHLHYHLAFVLPLFSPSPSSFCHHSIIILSLFSLPSFCLYSASIFTITITIIPPSLSLFYFLFSSIFTF